MCQYFLLITLISWAKLKENVASVGEEHRGGLIYKMADVSMLRSCSTLHKTVINFLEWLSTFGAGEGGAIRRRRSLFQLFGCPFPTILISFQSLEIKLPPGRWNGKGAIWSGLKEKLRQTTQTMAYRFHTFQCFTRFTWYRIRPALYDNLQHNEVNHFTLFVVIHYATHVRRQQCPEHKWVVTT